MQNIIKQTCKELGLTYKQLGEKIGYGEEAVLKPARIDNISPQMQKALELFFGKPRIKIKIKDV